MSEDETVVREAWERVSIGQPTTTDWDGEYKLSIGGNAPCFIDTTPEGCWSAARKFTDKRAEKIRKVREEIALQLQVARIVPVNDVMTLNRTVARLQAVLDDLLKGWRQ